MLTKMSRGMEALSYERELKEFVLFSLAKQGLRGNTTALCEYFTLSIPSSRMREDPFKLKYNFGTGANM